MKASDFLAEFKQKYSPGDIIKQLQSLRDLRVLVIGDAIIDQYHYCSSIGKSPKDNVMVVRYLSEENFAGGVLAAANHIAGFCDKVDLVTCLGKQNTYEDFIRKHLKKNITPTFFLRDDVGTTVKRRFVEPNTLTKIFGVSCLEDYELPESITKLLYEYLVTKIGNYDMVLVTDFGHGFINSQVINALDNAKFLAVNTQTNTDNVGFNLITKYKWADYICLDEPETRLTCHDKYGNIENLVLSISGKLACHKIAVTHGKNDTLMYDGNFYQIPTFSNGVRDTTGAGDAFLSISSLCVARDLPMDMVGFIGNAVGAIKVKTVCNRSSVEPEELFSFIRGLF